MVLGADREAGLLEPLPALPLEGLATRQADEEPPQQAVLGYLEAWHFKVTS